MTEEETAAKKAEGVARHKADPWGYDWVGPPITFILGLCAEFPDYFPIEEGVKVVNQYMAATADSLPYVETDKWDAGLRQTVLNRLAALCSKCTKCALSENRVPKRGSTFIDGKVDAAVLGVGEGPGAYESITGLPFVDAEALRSSSCATSCDNFEACFITEHGDWARAPQRRCAYTPVVVDNKRLAYRLRKKNPGGLSTTGQLLGTELRRTKMYRPSYVKMLKMSEDVGVVEKGKYPEIKPNVALTNAVRCRATQRVDGRVKDATPTAEQIAACNPWLEMTIRLVKPTRLLAIGNSGLTALHPEIPKGWKITQACASDNPTVQLANGKSAFVVLHPSYLNRTLTQSGKEAFDALLQKFGLTLRDCYLSAMSEKEAEGPAKTEETVT